MKIAILGTRGIPAGYGGFETFAEECGARLAARGHRVTVYGRSHYVAAGLKSHRGVDIVRLPTLRGKYTDTIVHTFLSVLHSLAGGYDVMLLCNAANSIYAWIPRLFGTPVAVNVDGIERRRSKWNRLGRLWYLLSERFSVWFPNAVVTDARVIEQYYRSRYGCGSLFIPYGADAEAPRGTGTLTALGLEPRDYFLYVSRFEPENNLHRVVAAFEKVRTAKRLVAVGDAPYARDYIASVKATRDPRIMFPGAIYGQGYRELQANAFCYVHATEVGGTHPALIEAMALGGLVIANGTPENREVVERCGLLYRMNDVEDLAGRLQDAADRPEEFASLREAARVRARAEYSWESVTDRYEDLLTRLSRFRRQGP